MSQCPVLRRCPCTQARDHNMTHTVQTRQARCHCKPVAAYFHFALQKEYFVATWQYHGRHSMHPALQQTGSHWRCRRSRMERPPCQP